MYVLTATRPSLNKTTNDTEVETRSSIQWKVETHTMQRALNCPGETTQCIRGGHQTISVYELIKRSNEDPSTTDHNTPDMGQAQGHDVPVCHYFMVD